MREMAFVHAGFALLMAFYARRCWPNLGSPDIRRDAIARNGLEFAVPAFLLSAGAAVYWCFRWYQG